MISQSPYRVYHVLCVAFLYHRAAYCHPEIEGVRVRDVFLRDELGHRSKTIVRLRDHPRRAFGFGLQLNVAGGEVQGQAVAADVLLVAPKSSFFK